jgi:hypothetical protein
MEIPEKGYYYHYKHNPNGEAGNYTYEVLNIAHHTEVEGSENSAMVIYRPLYESYVYKLGKRWDARPLSMFMENVIKDGKTLKRFTIITDPKIILELEKIKVEMYGVSN